MLLWVVLIIIVSALYFAAHCVTDFSVDPPRYWQRPSSYGRTLLLAALLWSLASLAPTLWHHRHAFDREDWEGARILWHDLVPSLPAALGVPALGMGILLLTSAFSRVGASPHCRHCGYQRAGAGRILTPRCPECGRRWSFFGDAARGRPEFDNIRAAWGLLFSAVGATAVLLQDWL
jgi:hypothetical protein